MGLHQLGALELVLHNVLAPAMLAVGIIASNLIRKISPFCPV